MRTLTARRCIHLDPMLRRRVTKLLVSASCAVVVLAQGDVRGEIQAIYDRAGAATVSARTLADLDAIHAWLDLPDCGYTDFGQPTRTWAEQRRYADEDLRTPMLSMSNHIQKIQIDGRTATTTTLVKGTASIMDFDGRFGSKKGVVHLVETTATVRDVWIKASDGWRRKSHTKIVGNRITAIDGKTQ